MVSLQVLSVDSKDASPCIVVTTENLRLMFDVGEGTQRLALEHGVRLSKLEGIFLTRLCSQTVCGLPGMVLTVADVGKEGFSVYGPHGIKNFWRSTRFFMRRPNFNIHLQECSLPTNPNSGEQLFEANGKEKEVYDRISRTPCFTDFMGEVGVHCLPFASVLEGDKASTSHVCYVCETPQTPGKFDVQRAKSLGLKPGPVYGVLKAGKSVTMDDGTIIEPSQVLEPPTPGRYFAVICNASAEGTDLLSRIVGDSYWALFNREKGHLASQLDCVVHLSPRSTVKQPAYRKWMATLGSTSTTHVMVGSGLCSGETSFIAATRYCNKLNTLCPQLFCKLDLEDALAEPRSDSAVTTTAATATATATATTAGKSTGTDTWRGDIDMVIEVDRAMSNVECGSNGADTPQHDAGTSTTTTREVRGRPLQSFVCTPAKRRGLSDNPLGQDGEVQEWWEHLHSKESTRAELQSRLEHVSYMQEVVQRSKDDANPRRGEFEVNNIGPEEQSVLPYELHSERAALLNDSFGDHRLWVLGTGSAVPSKYRNVTGMLLQIPGSACQESSGHHDRGALMVLDAGEGTWQQMVRMVSHHPALLQKGGLRAQGQGQRGGQETTMSPAYELASRLRLVWISHPHADHHLGITRILAECKRLRGEAFEPIVVIAPNAVLLYLQEYAIADPSIRDTYVSVSTSLLEPSPSILRSEVYSNGSGSGSGIMESAYHLDDNAAIARSSSLSPGRSSGTTAAVGETQPASDEVLRQVRGVWESLGVVDITNTRVTHCNQAYGVRVTLSSSSSQASGGNDNSNSNSSSKTEMTVVYSGDTRPCEALVALGKGASLLIHEATFGDDKQAEAESKRHSTIGEALDVALRMSAFRTVLTHFSQRYPSAPPIEEARELQQQQQQQQQRGGGTSSSKSILAPILAFDFMHISFRDLLWAPAVTSAISVAFPAEGENEDDEDEIGIAEAAAAASAPSRNSNKAKAVDNTVPGAFAMHNLCRARGSCNCYDLFELNEDEDEDDESRVIKASDKARRKRKASLLERGRQKSRANKW